MNLNELRTLLENHPKTILVEDLPNEDFGFYLFWRVTYETNRANEANQSSVCVIVKDRGEAGERAWFKGVPGYLRSTAFEERVVSAIETYQETHPELERYVVEGLNEDEKAATVRAYVHDGEADSVSLIRYIIWEKADASLGFRRLASES